MALNKELGINVNILCEILNAGWIYIYALKNRSFGDYVIKIGMTTRKPNIRAREIYSGASGVPEPFDVVFACQVSDCEVTEKKIHKRLKAYRCNKDREFFIISMEVARKIILKICQEVDKQLGYSAQNPRVIDSRVPDDLDSFSEDSLANNSFEIIELSLDELVLSAPGKSSLSKEQKERIEIIEEIFINVFPQVLKNWEIDFSRDTNPEIEICIWENIAKAFLKVEQDRYLSEEQKKEAFYLLFIRSMMSSSKVLENFKAKTLCKRAVKEILRGYEANPIPISVSLLAQ